MWTELEQLSTVPVRCMLVPVRPSIFGTLTAFQDLRVCLSYSQTGPNGSYVTYKILFLQCLQPAGHILVIS